MSRPVFAQPRLDSRKLATAQAWVSNALLAIIVAGLTLGIGRATNVFENSPPPPGEETIIPFSGFVNGEGTPVPMGASSSFPVPISANCTVEPLTREDVVAHLDAANVATEPAYQVYEQAIIPTSDDALGIMESYRTWQACSLGDKAIAYGLALQTPYYTGQFGLVAAEKGSSANPTQPLSDERVQEIADAAVVDDGVTRLMPASTPTFAEIDAQIAADATAVAQRGRSLVPLPDDATPFEFETIRPVISTIFAADIQIVGPDVALVMTVTVDAETGEVLNQGRNELRFVKVDGIWKIDLESSPGKG